MMDTAPHHPDQDPEAHDRGLSFDLTTLLARRQTLKLLAGAGLVALVGCGSSSDDDGDDALPGSNDGEAIPEETNGPFPADGSNGPNVLTESGIVRSDIRSSYGGSSGVADGTPLTLTMTVTDVGGEALAGAAVYVWHCDREGRYSLYSRGATNQNYLRGVQEADGDGKVAFTSIVPGCYTGRWPHIHFEVFPSLDEATAAGTRLVTSQLAFPADVLDEAYAADGYHQSVLNLTGVSLETDSVFSDGYDLEMATVTGHVADGYTAELAVPVAT